MLTKITLIVALCSGIHAHDVQNRIAELQKRNPDSAVSVRIEKKAACANGQVITGQQAKLMKQLEELK